LVEGVVTGFLFQNGGTGFPQVAVGDDADEPLLLRDGQVANPVFLQKMKGLLECRIRPDGVDLAVHDFIDQHGGIPFSSFSEKAVSLALFYLFVRKK